MQTNIDMFGVDAIDSSDRWKRVNNYTQNNHRNRPTKQRDIGINLVSPDITTRYDSKTFSKLLSNKLYVSIIVAILVALLLFSMRPPFVCTRKTSPINQAHYVEHISQTRFTAWIILSFSLTYFGDYIIYGLKLIHTNTV